MIGEIDGKGLVITSGLRCVRVPEPDPLSWARCKLDLAERLGFEKLYDVFLLFERLWEGWLEHPAFDWYYGEHLLGGRHKYQPELTLYSVQCRAVFEHEPGVQGMTRSWSVASIEDMGPKHIAKGERHLGKFVGIEPIGPDDQLSILFPAIVSHSYKGSNKAFYARMILKEMLPRKLKPWVSKARRANAKPKWWYLRNLVELEEWEEITHLCESDLRRLKSRAGHLVPKEYWTMGKGELWLADAMPDEDKAMMQQYMSLGDFWRCATGRIHPDSVHELVTHQLSLPMEV